MSDKFTEPEYDGLEYFWSSIEAPASNVAIYGTNLNADYEDAFRVEVRDKKIFRKWTIAGTTNTLAEAFELAESELTKRSKE